MLVASKQAPPHDSRGKQLKADFFAERARAAEPRLRAELRLFHERSLDASLVDLSALSAMSRGW